MIELLIALGIVLIILPAIIGWLVLVRSFARAYIARRNRKRWLGLIAEHQRVTAQLAQLTRTPLHRRRQLRAVTGGRRPDCELVTLGSDGPRAA